MKYLLVAIINLIYGILLLFTISSDTPGLFLVLAIGSILVILGIAGLILWIKMITSPLPSEEKDQTIKNWFNLVKSFDIVLIIGLLFRVFIFQPYMVEGSSMENNFHDREVLLVDKISFKLREPRRGNVIIFKAPQNPNEDYIKRIIGLPGEEVSINDNEVLINNKVLKESYLSSNMFTYSPNQSTYQTTLKNNEYFVMGDNRTNSSDSREWGPVPKGNIIGKAWLKVYPFIYWGLVKNPNPVLSNSL